jgi:hypothetical protein
LILGNTCLKAPLGFRPDIAKSASTVSDEITIGGKFRHQICLTQTKSGRFKLRRIAARALPNGSGGEAFCSSLVTGKLVAINIPCGRAPSLKN